MRQYETTIKPVPIDANGIAVAQAVAAAGPLTLNGALIADSIFTGDYARQISITSDGADGGRAFTVTGTDADGTVQTEDITGPATATVESVKYWSTVISIVADAACAGNISSGTVDEFVTKTIPLETYESDGVTVAVEVFTGTANISVQQTFSRVQYTQPAIFYAGPTDLTAITAVAFDDMNIHASGLRVVFNSYTSGASIRLVVNPNRSY